MLRRRKGSGDYAVSAVLAVMVAGLLYVGVLLVTDSEKPGASMVVENAIRLAQPEPEPPEPEDRKPKEPEPPKDLPKTFSSAPKNAAVRPKLNLSMPSFSADIHPALTGGVSMPAGGLDGIGFSLDEVDEAPQVLRNIPPEYPYGAKRNHIEGQVVVRMLVTSDGTPTRLTIHSADPPGVFEKASLAAAKRWKFKPGRYQGKDVDTWVLLPFNFELLQ